MNTQTPHTWFNNSTQQIELAGKCDDPGLIEAALETGYINRFNQGLFDVLDYTHVPDGFRLVCPRLGTNLPESSIRVGQVVVRHGDPEFPLYVVRA